MFTNFYFNGVLTVANESLLKFLRFSLSLPNNHSHKKQKDSPESSIIYVWTWVPQDTSTQAKVKIESAGKSKQLYSLCDQFFRALICLHLIFLILICF